MLVRIRRLRDSAAVMLAAPLATLAVYLMSTGGDFKAIVENPLDAKTICGKIGWSAGAGDERAFLEAYYAQLRARLETGMRFGRRKADKHSGG